MGKESAFIKGFEKKSEMVPNRFLSKALHPVSTYRAAANTSGQKLKKYIGMGLLGTGAGMYGLRQVSKNEEEMPSRQLAYGGVQ